MNYTAVIKYCKDTDLYVGYIPGFSGAHSQGQNLEELNANLREVISMLLEDGVPNLQTQFSRSHAPAWECRENLKIGKKSRLISNSKFLF